MNDSLREFWICASFGATTVTRVIALDRKQGEQKYLQFFTGKTIGLEINFNEELQIFGGKRIAKAIQCA